MNFGYQMLGFGGGEDADKSFILVMATTGTAETVTIPCQNVGTFDATIDWGDGASSTITTFNDADLAHEYADIADHTITITGTFPNIYFNDTGDKLKLKKVLNFGDTGLITMGSSFFGCSNLTEVLSTHTNMSGITTFSQCFRACASLTTIESGGWNLSSVTTFQDLAVSCGNLTSIDVTNWDVSAVTNMRSMFNACTSLASIDVANWDVSSVTDMVNTFRGMTAITDIAIDGWDVSGVTAASLGAQTFMLNTSITTATYDAALIHYDSLTVNSGVEWGFGANQYSAGAAATARQSLIDNDTWTINDGGQV